MGSENILPDGTIVSVDPNFLKGNRPEYGRVLGWHISADWNEGRHSPNMNFGYYIRLIKSGMEIEVPKEGIMGFVRSV